MDLASMKIVVAGGATGGAAAALLLARAGARVTVLERVESPRAVGAGIGLADNGLAVLESLGLGAALATVARPVGAPRIVDGAGRTIFAPPGPSPRVWMVRRGDLQGLLLDALSAEPRIELRCGAEVVRAAPDGRVGVRAAGRELELTADLVIGADGVGSRVREGGRFGARLAAPGIPYLRALVSSAPALGEEAWTAAGLFGSFAVADGVYVYASAGSRRTRAAIAARDLEALAAAWAAAYPPSAPLLAGVERFEDLIIHPVQRVDCARWHDGAARAGGRRRARHGAEPRPGCQQRAGRRRRAARRAAPRRDPDGRVGRLRGAPSPRGPPGGGGRGPPRSPRRVDAAARTPRARPRSDAARLPTRAPERSRPPAPGVPRDLLAIGRA